MTIKFASLIPENLASPPVIISGNEASTSLGYSTQYLELDRGDSFTYYEIRYEYQCSPFKEAIIKEDVLAVGFEEYFYLFNICTNQSLQVLKCDGYFGHLYYNEELWYVADAYYIRCFDKCGIIKWQSPELGIDGVIIETFTDTEICGVGENNPPDGWINFKIDRINGEKII